MSLSRRGLFGFAAATAAASAAPRVSALGANQMINVRIDEYKGTVLPSEVNPRAPIWEAYLNQEKSYCLSLLFTSEPFEGLQLGWLVFLFQCDDGPLEELWRTISVRWVGGHENLAKISKGGSLMWRCHLTPTTVKKAADGRYKFVFPWVVLAEKSLPVLVEQIMDKLMDMNAIYGRDLATLRELCPSEDVSELLAAARCAGWRGPGHIISPIETERAMLAKWAPWIRQVMARVFL